MSDDRPQAHPPRNQHDDVTREQHEVAPADEGHAPSPAVPVGDGTRDAESQARDAEARDRDAQNQDAQNRDAQNRDAQDQDAENREAGAQRDESHSSAEDETLARNAARPVPTAAPPSVDEGSTLGDRAENRRDEVSDRHDDETDRRQLDEDDRRRQAEDDRRRQDAATPGGSHDSATKVQPVVTEHPVTAPDSRYARPTAATVAATAAAHGDNTRNTDDARNTGDARNTDNSRNTDSPYTATPTAQTERYQPEPAQQQAPQAEPTPIYVQAPVPPRKKSNRGVGLLIAFAATLLFALLYALGTATLASVNGADSFGEPLLRYLATPVFWIPVLVFFVAFALLVLLVNRANWWAYVLGGFPVAVIVYLAYIGARLIQLDITQLTPDEAALVVQRVSTFPDGILAAVLAREIVIWAGAIISARGRRLKVRNAEARAEYDRKVAETPGL